MHIVASIILLVYFILNINFFLLVNKKVFYKNISDIRSNTTRLFLSFTILIIINAMLIVFILVIEQFIDINHKQGLIDQFATIGFAIFLIFSFIIYVYFRKYKKVVNITHSIGLTCIYALEYAIVMSVTAYYLVLYI